MTHNINVKKTPAIGLLLILCLLFSLLAFEAAAQADSWSIREAPHDEKAERSLGLWIDLHRNKLWDEFNPEEQRLLQRIIKGTLIWAHQYGNTFDHEKFLSFFSNRDDSVTCYPLYNGGILLLLKGTYLKIDLDRFVPPELPPHLLTGFPQEGRWYAAFGHGNETMLFYFNAIRSARLLPQRGTE